MLLTIVYWRAFLTILAYIFTLVPSFTSRPQHRISLRGFHVSVDKSIILS